MKFLINTCLRSKLSVQLCRNWLTFPFAGSNVQLQKNPSLSLWSYTACNSFYFASRRWSYIKLLPEFQKNCIFWWHCAVQWWGEHRDLWRFGLWYYFLPGTPTKIRQINRERNYISRSCDKPKCIHSNDQQNCFIDEKHNSDIFLNPYILWDSVPCHSTTLMTDTLRPKSTLNQQLTKLEQTQIRCSLHCEGWTVKGRDCASALHSFNEITYQTDDWTKQLLRLKSWVISVNQEFLHLWSIKIVSKCSYWFHFFEFYFLMVHYLFSFFEKITYLFPFLDDFEWEVKVHHQLLCKVTLLRQAKLQPILVHCRSSP